MSIVDTFDFNKFADSLCDHVDGQSGFGRIDDYRLMIRDSDIYQIMREVTGRLNSLDETSDILAMATKLKIIEYFMDYYWLDESVYKIWKDEQCSY